MAERAGFAAEAPDATDAGTGQADLQIGACGRNHLQRLRCLELAHGGTHGRLVFSARQTTLEDLRMFMTDHQHARAAAQDARQLGRMLQPFHRAIDDETGACQGLHHGFQTTDGVAGASGPHGHR